MTTETAQTAPIQSLTAEQQIIQTLRKLVPDRECIELRIQKKPRYWMSGNFDSNHLEALARQAIIAETSFPTTGTYIVLNRINPALLARRANRFDTFVEDKTLTSNDDIIRWCYLPIDIDPVRPTGISSTDEELLMAKAKSDEVVKYLTANGFPLPLTGMSGNGYHIVYKIDMERSPENDLVVKHILNHLDEKFSDKEPEEETTEKPIRIGIDTVNNNPARIFKLYGTMSCKGDNTPERPHRRSHLISVPEPFVTIETAFLLKFCKEHPLKSDSGSATKKKSASKLKDPKDVTSRHPELLKTVGKMVNSNFSHAAILAACEKQNAEFPEPKPADVLTAEVSKLIEFCRKRQEEVSKKPSYIYPVIDDETGEVTGYRIDYMEYSDYLHDRFHVYFFMNTLYIFDENQSVYQTHMNQLETHVRNTCKEHDIPGKLSTIEREIITHLRSMGNVSDYPFVGTLGSINARNGSLDLSTGNLVPTTHEHLYDYRIETMYREFPEGTPELDNFLTLYKTRESIDILAKAIWQRAYHDTLKEITVLYGPKDSGKTTVVELVQSTLDGDMNKNKNVSRTLLHELLQRFGYAALEGKLLNFGDDLPDMFIRNAGKINEMVGSVVRHIEKKGVDGYDATVTAYYTFTTNNLPPLDDDDSVIWGKIHLVEFKKKLDVPFVPRETLFTQTIKEQLLYRAVERAREWNTARYQNDQTPDEVRIRWHEASTDVDTYMLESTEYDPNCVPVTLEQVKKHYEEWCIRNNRTRHVKYLQKKIQPYIVRRNMGNYYVIMLKPFEGKEKIGQAKQATVV